MRIFTSICLLIISLAASSSAREGGVGDSDPEHYSEVLVRNGQCNRGKVVAQKNRLVFEGVDGKKVAVSEPFLTSDTDWRPSGPVDCSWSPDGKFLVIFIPHPRVTVISAVNLENQASMRQTFPDDRHYPDWYDHIFSTHDTPTKWHEGKLEMRTEVLTGSGEKKMLTRELSFSGDSFKILVKTPSN